MKFKSNELVKLYLIHSYLYYELDTSLITDYEFDVLCDQLLKEYDTIEHMHKYLIDKESLKAHTGYTLKYPEVIKVLAERLLSSYECGIPTLAPDH